RMVVAAPAGASVPGRARASGGGGARAEPVDVVDLLQPHVLDVVVDGLALQRGRDAERQVVVPHDGQLAEADVVGPAVLEVDAQRAERPRLEEGAELVGLHVVCPPEGSSSLGFYPARGAADKDGRPRRPATVVAAAGIC